MKEAIIILEEEQRGKHFRRVVTVAIARDMAHAERIVVKTHANFVAKFGASPKPRRRWFVPTIVEQEVYDLITGLDS